MNQPTQLAMPLPMDALAAFCKKWRIVKLSVFGSILRDDFRPDSDVDLLNVDGVQRSDNWIRREEILGSAFTLIEQA